MAITSAWLALLCLLLGPFLCSGFSQDRPTDQRILVLLDDLSIKSSHSIFFKSLSDRGYELAFKLADDPKLALQRYGEFLYDALILFAPSVESLGGTLDVAAVLDFIDAGHDLILAADTSTSDVIRDIATECGADFDEEPEAVVIDHMNFSVSQTESDHSLIAADSFVDAPVILGSNNIQAPVLFRGIAHAVNPASELVVKVLSASQSAFSANPNTDLLAVPALTGTSIALVSVVQARNNARILISGSLELFSDKFFRSAVEKFGSESRHSKAGNEQFAVELSKWTFHERGHLKCAVGAPILKLLCSGAPCDTLVILNGDVECCRSPSVSLSEVVLQSVDVGLPHGPGKSTKRAPKSGWLDLVVVAKIAPNLLDIRAVGTDGQAVDVQHHKIGETNAPPMYRITDQVEYSVEIHEWTGTEWQPYEADDVQVQFYMMSPYVLKTLSHDGKGLYSTSFQVPDVYGVFQFKVEYRRLGYTSLTLSKQGIEGESKAALELVYSPSSGHRGLLIPVRPFRHNEYERFIPAAFPYYGGAFSTMTAFFVFSIVFLYHK